MCTGIVHRDVKPQNCIISSIDNKIKLIDLGESHGLADAVGYRDVRTTQLNTDTNCCLR